MRQLHIALFALVFAGLSLAPSHRSWVFVGTANGAYAVALQALALGALLLDRDLRRRLFARADLPLGLLLLAFAASAGAARDAAVAGETYLQLAPLLLLAYFFAKGLFSDRGLWRPLVLVITAASAAVALYGIVEALSGFNPLYELLPRNPFYERYRQVHRPVSTQFNPGTLATYLLFAIPFAFHAARSSAGWTRRLASAALALDAACLVLTFSRGGVLGLAGAAFVWLALGRRFKAIAAGGALLLALALSAPLLPQQAFRFGFGWTLGGNTGIVSAYRLDRLEMAFAMCRSSPAFGVGLRHFRLRFEEFYPDREHLARSLEVEQLRGKPSIRRFADNMYLTILAETGLVGSAAFLFFVASLFGRGLAARRAAPRAEPAAGGTRRELLAVALAALAGQLLNMAGFEYLYWLAPCVLFGLACGALSALAAPGLDPRDAASGGGVQTSRPESGEACFRLASRQEMKLSSSWRSAL